MTTPFPFVAASTLLASQLNAITTLVTSTKTASHTLTIADVSTRVIMNSASATTITVNTSIFGASDVVEILNIGAGVCTVTAGSCTVGTSGTLALVQNAGGTLTFISASASVFRATGVAASGGLVCTKAQTAFTSVSSVNVDNAFSSSYTNYRIFVTLSAGTGSFTMKLRAGGVDTTTNYGTYNTAGVTATLSLIKNGLGTDEFYFGDRNAKGAGYDISVIAPQVAQPTGITTSIYSSYGPDDYSYLTVGNQNSSTQFDGFTLLIDTTAMTGTYAVYGFSKTV